MTVSAAALGGQAQDPVAAVVGQVLHVDPQADVADQLDQRDAARAAACPGSGPGSYGARGVVSFTLSALQKAWRGISGTVLGAG
jgi:hypothetical protein